MVLCRRLFEDVGSRVDEQFDEIFSDVQAARLVGLTTAQGRVLNGKQGELTSKCSSGRVGVRFQGATASKSIKVEGLCSQGCPSKQKRG